MNMGVVSCEKVLPTNLLADLPSAPCHQRCRVCLQISLGIFFTCATFLFLSYLLALGSTPAIYIVISIIIIILTVLCFQQ